MISSIDILNPSSSWSPARPKFLRVGRPYTEEYCRQKKNDWFFRCWQQFLATRKRGGSCWIPTFTYNNENLPYLFLSDYVDSLPIVSLTPNSSCINISNDDCVMCFRDDDVRLAMKELRIYLHRAGFNAKAMKYIVCSEFGEKRHRPHYHVFLAIEDDVPYSVMVSCLRRAWKFGFVGCSKRFGMKCNSVFGIRYATKYAIKDIGYSRCQKFKCGLTIDEVVYRQDGYEPKELKKLLRPYMPKIYTSKGLGIDYIQQLSKLDENELLALFLGDKKVVYPLGNGMEFTIPLYYQNKFNYIVDKDLTRYYGHVVMALTDFGVKCERARFARRIDRVSDKLHSLTYDVAKKYSVLDEYCNLPKGSISDIQIIWYMAFFRYWIPQDENGVYNRDMSVYDCMVNKEKIFDWSLNTRKANIYLCNFLDIHGLVDSDWYRENVPVPLKRPSYDNKIDVCSSWLTCATCSELPQFSALERLARAYDDIFDRIFQENEKSKYDKRMKEAAAKLKTFYPNNKLNVNLVTVYESEKDS